MYYKRKPVAHGNKNLVTWHQNNKPPIAAKPESCLHLEEEQKYSYLRKIEKILMLL